MTTQNVNLYHTAWVNAAGAPTTYYYPSSAGADGDGYDDIAFELQLVSGNANNTVTATVESDDGGGTWAWDESLGLYDWIIGARGTASWTANNATVHARLTARNHGAKKWRVKIVVTVAVAPVNSGVVSIRRVKE